MESFLAAYESATLLVTVQLNEVRVQLEIQPQLCTSLYWVDTYTLLRSGVYNHVNKWDSMELAADGGQGLCIVSDGENFILVRIHVFAVL